MTDDDANLERRKEARGKSAREYPIRWRYPAVDGVFAGYLALLFHEDGSVTWDVEEFKEKEAEVLDRMFGVETRP